MRGKFVSPIHGLNNLAENDSPSIPNTISYQQFLNKCWFLAVGIVVLFQQLEQFIHGV